MYKLLRLDTGETIDLNEYYQNWVNTGSIEGIRKKYNLINTSHGYTLVQSGWDHPGIIPGYVLDIVEVPDV
jgi:hypothetical protein